jgi:hypothetical protein
MGSVLTSTPMAYQTKSRDGGGADEDRAADT